MNEHRKEATLMLALCGALALNAAEISLKPAEATNPLVVDISGATTLSDWLAAEGKSLSDYDALVKRGTGTLTSDASIATFGGEIVVEAGRLVAAASGALGSSSGATFVLDGATLEIATANGCPDFTAEPMVISGEGDSAKAGAIVVSGGQYANTAFGPIHLAGSATVGLQEKSNRDFGAIDLNGHDLTIAGCSTGFDDVYVTDAVSGPGRLIREGGYLGCNGGRFPAGETAGSILVRTGSGWKAGDVPEGAWSIVFEADTKLYIPPVAGNLSWDGDVTLQGNVDIWRWSGDCQYALCGKVSGPGGFTVEGGCRLVLENAANDFTGGIVVLADGLGVRATCAGALPDTAAGLTLRGGTVELASSESYALPPLTIDGAAGTTANVSGFHVDGNQPYSFTAWDWTKGSWATAVVKRGGGELLYDTPVGAAVLDVEEGSVRLGTARNVLVEFTRKPGLWEGNFPANSSNKLSSRDEYPTDMSTVRTNVLAGSVLWDYRVNENSTLVYRGYLWNREATNVVWSWGIGVQNCGALYIDDDKILETSWNEVKWADVTLTPGAHAFEYRQWSWSGWMTGLRDGVCVESGLVADTLGRGTQDVADYRVLLDPGDGSIFTRTTDDVCRFEAVAPAFGKAKFAKGTSFDLGGYGSYAFADVEGFPQLTGGDVSVSGMWTIPAGEMIDGGTASASGNVVFKDGASVFVDDTGKKPSAAREFPILTAEAIVLPEGRLTVESASGDRYGLSLSEDGRTLSIRRITSFFLKIR